MREMIQFQWLDLVGVDVGGRQMRFVRFLRLGLEVQLNVEVREVGNFPFPQS